MMRLSVHMMVLNCKDVIERALRPFQDLAGQVEICVVDTGSTDGSVDRIREICEHLGLGYKAMFVSPKTNPELYFNDEPSSWNREVPGPFTGKPILRDWSYVRNEGLKLCDAPYVMKLDADDEVFESSNIPPTLDYLDTRSDIDIVACPYEIMDGKGEIEQRQIYDRFWRNGKVHCVETMHEYFPEKNNINHLIMLQGMSFRDWRDSPGDGIRLHLRNYKILLGEYERREQTGMSFVSNSSDVRFLFTLGHEAVNAEPNFARHVLALASLLNGSSFLPEAEIIFHQARAYEIEDELVLARSCYEKAASLGKDIIFNLHLGMLQKKMGDLDWQKTLKKAVVAAKTSSMYNIPLKMLREAEKLIS